MRTTIDIDQELLDRASQVAKGKTKKAVVEEALKELVRKRGIERLRQMIGNAEHEIDMTPEELDRFRGRDRTFIPD
jgi:Arc/MetJ family transcription regulator